MSYNCSIYAISSGKEPIRSLHTAASLVNKCGEYERIFQPKQKPKKGAKSKRSTAATPDWLKVLTEEQ